MLDISDLFTWWDQNFNQYAQDLSEYVGIPSVAVKEKWEYPFGINCYRMLTFIENLMKKYGLETEIIKNVFAQGLLKGSGDKTVAIACHGDVVPAEGEWDRDPFMLYQKEDHLVGRGTTDNKGAGMTALYSIRYLIEKGWRPRTNIKLLFGSAEEIGMPDYDIAFKGMKIADITLVPDSGFPVCYGEKASLKYSFKLDFDKNKIRNIKAGSGVAVIDKASLELFTDKVIDSKENIEIERINSNWVRITAYGKARHSATPEGGVDALCILFLFVDKLILDKGVKAYLSLFPDFYGTGLNIDSSDDESGRLTAVVTSYNNESGNLNIRLPLSADIKKVKKTIEESGINFCLENETCGYKIEKNTMIYALNDIANAEYNSNKEPYVMAGGTYARLMQPAVAFGMGSPNGNKMPPFPQGQGRAHQRNESVDIDRMKKGFAIYVKSLLFLEDYFNGTV